MGALSLQLTCFNFRINEDPFLASLHQKLLGLLESQDLCSCINILMVCGPATVPASLRMYFGPLISVQPHLAKGIASINALTQ